MDTKFTKLMQVRVPRELLAEIDAAAERKHMTRTAFVLNACRKVLETEAFLKAQPDIMKKMAELNEALSEAAKYQDKDFQGVFGQEKLKL